MRSTKIVTALSVVVVGTAVLAGTASAVSHGYFNTSTLARSVRSTLVQKVKGIDAVGGYDGYMLSVGRSIVCARTSSENSPPAGYANFICKFSTVGHSAAGSTTWDYVYNIRVYDGGNDWQSTGNPILIG